MSLQIVIRSIESQGDMQIQPGEPNAYMALLSVPEGIDIPISLNPGILQLRGIQVIMVQLYNSGTDLTDVTFHAGLQQIRNRKLYIEEGVL